MRKDGCRYECGLHSADGRVRLDLGFAIRPATVVDVADQLLAPGTANPGISVFSPPTLPPESRGLLGIKPAQVVWLPLQVATQVRRGGSIQPATSSPVERPGNARTRKLIAALRDQTGRRRPS